MEASTVGLGLRALPKANPQPGVKVPKRKGSRSRPLQVFKSVDGLRPTLRRRSANKTGHTHQQQWRTSRKRHDFNGDAVQSRAPAARIQRDAKVRFVSVAGSPGT